MLHRCYDPMSLRLMVPGFVAAETRSFSSGMLAFCAGEGNTQKGDRFMRLIKCPRCELNYIQESEKYCKVCLRELRGEQAREEMELCSICNAAPALPGKDVCLSCLKEMQQTGTDDDGGDDHEPVDESTIGMNSVSTMDEIIPQVHEDIPEREYGEIESELSLESVIEDEQKDDDDDEDGDRD